MTPIPIPLKTLYHDEHLVVIDKPCRLLVHRSRLDVHANEFAVQLLRDQIGQSVFPVHRIDRPTSGVLVFALSPEVARDLTNQFTEREVDKSYLAIVRGHPPFKTTWSEPLVEKLDRVADRRAAADKPAQSAVSIIESMRHWTVPFSTGKYPSSRYSLVSAKPLTGRKHQLRRHLNHMAYPIIGDTTYGDRRHNRLFRETFGVSRLMLMAKRITFTHPVSKLPITVDAPVAAEFELAMDRLTYHAISSTTHIPSEGYS